jgi:hypothetical protein
MSAKRTYSLDDPALDEAMREQAEKTAANWPALNPGQLARLAPLLEQTVEAAPAKRTRRKSATPARASRRDAA